ncbi:MAG TPA: hypothetical protein H9919_04230 [Candidatus Alistipes excrementipullorum]|nr:hypothetical protein [Candidatus Alistipes excrementipullorum]
MKNRFLPIISLCIGIVCMISSCGKTDDGTGLSASVDFSMEFLSQTRAPEALDTNSYTAKVYMFKEESSGSNRFVYHGEQTITSSNLTVGGLVSGTKYRFVFLAIPKRQQPSLPTFTSTRPEYINAVATYLSGTQTGNEIFRNIFTFTASVNLSRYSIVLTRQNGALQIRINNSDGFIRSVKLEVASQSAMYLNDGTGGQVITSGNAISLSKSAQPYWTSDYRISINVLPTEDITGKGQLTLTYYNGRSAVYSLKSTSGRIPIYPNQITWLVMGRDCHYGGNDNDSEAESRTIFGDMQKSDMNTSIGHDEDSCIEF